MPGNRPIGLPRTYKAADNASMLWPWHCEAMLVDKARPEAECYTALRQGTCCLQFLI